MSNRPSRMNHVVFVALVAGSALAATPACGQTMHEEVKLVPNSGAAFDEFGYSIATNLGLVAVGARLDDDHGPNSGSAFVFDAATGAQIAKLLANDGNIDDWFGVSIAIADGIVAVGAPLDDNATFSGSVYLFNASTGVQLTKLVSNDGAAGDNFGWSVAINGGIVAVGAYRDDDNGSESGSAYLFNASTGAQIAKLLPTDGTAGDLFGNAIAIDNGIVAVGAHLHEDHGGSTGSAYLFDAATGDQLFELLPNDGALSDEFGYSIAIDNGIVAVGSYRDDDNGFDSGSVYLFDASTGAQIAKLLPSDGAENDWFGLSVAIDSGLVAVGAFLDDDNGDGSGSAYVFDASTGSQIAKLLSSDGAAFDRFGQSIAIENGVVAVGAFHDSDLGMWSGSAYVFKTCPADLTGSNDPNDPSFGVPNGILDANDFFFYLGRYAAGDLGVADLTGSLNPNDPGFGVPDGTLDASDFFFYLDLFAAGCP